MSSQNYEDEYGNNVIAVILKVIAWIIFIGGFIAGIVLANIEAS